MSPNACVYGNYFYVNADGEVLGVERRHRLGTEDKVGYLPLHGACTLFSTRALKAFGGYLENIDAQDGWVFWYKLCNREERLTLILLFFTTAKTATRLAATISGC